MNREEVFAEHISKGYSCKGDHIIIGSAILDGHVFSEAKVRINIRCTGNG
jgi:hypothetical protein